MASHGLVDFAYNQESVAQRPTSKQIEQASMEKAGVYEQGCFPKSLNESC